MYHHHHNHLCSHLTSPTVVTFHCFPFFLLCCFRFMSHHLPPPCPCCFPMMLFPKMLQKTSQEIQKLSHYGTPNSLFYKKVLWLLGLSQGVKSPKIAQFCTIYRHPAHALFQWYFFPRSWDFVKTEEKKNSLTHFDWNLFKHCFTCPAALKLFCPITSRKMWKTSCLFIICCSSR